MASAVTHKQARKQMQLKPAPKGLLCYVCQDPNKPIKWLHSDYTTIIQTEPELKARHNSCAPGTAKWMRSKFAKESEVAQFYVTNGEESAIMGLPMNKVKKAFPKKDPELSSEERQLCGRLKYMAYMDTQMKDGGEIQWVMYGMTSNIKLDYSEGKVTISDFVKDEVIIEDIPIATAHETLRGWFIEQYDKKGGQ